jgi:hypothetical protein
MGRNFLHSKLGRHAVSRVKIANIKESHSIRFGDKIVPKNDVEELLQFFKDSTEISYQVLWDVAMDKFDTDTPRASPGSPTLNTPPFQSL